MSEGALFRLARAAGLAVTWTDVHGRRRRVAPDTLRAVLEALGYASGSDRQIAASSRRIAHEAKQTPPLVVVRTGARVMGARGTGSLRLVAEDEREIDVNVTEEGKFRDPPQPGYYRVADHATRLAVVPRRAATISPRNDRKLWGIAVQLYSLRGQGPVGDFAALAALAEDAAHEGADAIAVSPVHALFGADPSHISPYSPSTRLFLNPLYIAAGRRKKAGTHGALIDWPRAARARFAALKRDFDAFRESRAGRGEFDAFVRRQGKSLLAHVRFEVLDARFRRQGNAGWRNWPHEWRDPWNPTVCSLTAADPDILFQLYLQWRADREMADAQARAKAAGMQIGLIADMAVGVDPAGSLAWSRPEEMLSGLTIGAPPDVFNSAGQDWGLTTFSPGGLRGSGFVGFIATLRAAMHNAGGMRLDHAMGLGRMWVVPRGASPVDGVYLDYPMRDLVGLIALESQRHRCAVVAEDLGTVPTGFRQKIADADLYGMRVLWFERGEKGRFLPPAQWDRKAIALTTTHDLPTIAGWWSGRDIAWRRKAGASAAETRKIRKERERDRGLLWRALKAAGCAKGSLPAPGKADSVIDASFGALGSTPCPVAIVVAEDILGLAEQPNLPGTVDEHPNWRHRLPVNRVFGSEAARARARILTKARAS